MTWLVWRQHRWDGTSALAIVVIVGAGILALTVLSSNLLSEIANACSMGSPNCGALRIDYDASFGRYQTFIFAIGVVLPALVGVFVGAPLVSREFEQGTHLLVWSQGTTRRRWFLSSVALVASAALAGAGLMAITYVVWLTPQQPVTNSWYQFDAGPVMTGYALFSLALGVALGALIQRSLPAMAATLVAFVAVRVPIALFVRPNFLPPLTWEVGKTLGTDSAWFIGPQQHVDLAGDQVSDVRFADAVGQCSGTYDPGAQIAGTQGPKPTGGGTFLADCLREHGIRVIQLYQPESRFWLFQAVEATIFLALAVLLLAIAYRLVMRSK